MKRIATSPVKETPAPPKRTALHRVPMEADPGLPGSPPGMPLQVVSPDRANQLRDSSLSALRPEGCSSPVLEKVNQFNSLSVVAQSRQLERKTADAALKRAMLGREEAEAEVRRCKEEARLLRKAIDEGKERERKVGERLETVMENFGRTKETHVHTKALWEKEIRRARKETFKTQSSIVKLQEELKSARTAVKILEENWEEEKERSHMREQEAFAARYQMVGLQEQLDQALEHIKLAEQERDAYKTAAQNEEVARIAAEGRIPLPAPERSDDEFASPKKKKQRWKSRMTGRDSRVSLSTMDIVSSEASELEIEALMLRLQWERQRADRAQDLIEFLQAENQLRCCSCSRTKEKASLVGSQQITQDEQEGKEEASENMIPQENTAREDVTPAHYETREVETVEADVDVDMSEPSAAAPEPAILGRVDANLKAPRSKKERHSTIFCPQEGIFRTVSEQEAESLQVPHVPQVSQDVDMGFDEDASPDSPEATCLEEDGVEEVGELSARVYARTPSVDPPAFARTCQERTSLLSLLSAPRADAQTTSLLPFMASVPSVPAGDAAASDQPLSAEWQELRPHSSTASYTVTTTVPVRDGSETSHGAPVYAGKGRASSGSNSSASSSSTTTTFDAKNPALTPTMTREQALAQIRKRRGRARSAATQCAATPRKMVVADKPHPKRDLSAPTAKAAARTRS